LQDAIAAYQGAMLAVTIEGDEFSCLRAEQRAIAGFSSARISQVRLGTGEVKSDNVREDGFGNEPESLGHFGWTRKPDAVEHAIVNGCSANSADSALGYLSPSFQNGT